MTSLNTGTSSTGFSVDPTALTDASTHLGDASTQWSQIDAKLKTDIANEYTSTSLCWADFPIPALYLGVFDAYANALQFHEQIAASGSQAFTSAQTALAQNGTSYSSADHTQAVAMNNTMPGPGGQPS